MVVWFYCCNSEGPSSLWLACCSVVFALSIPVTGERFRRAQITTFWWPKQLNFHLWCLICSAPSLYSLFFLHTEMCIGWWALNRELCIIVTCTGHSRIVGSQFTQSPFVPCLSWRAQSGRGTTFGRGAWFTESHTVLVTLFFTFWLIYSFIHLHLI